MAHLLSSLGVVDLGKFSTFLILFLYDNSFANHDRHRILGDYTRLDETIMVLRAAKAERKGAAVGFMAA